MPSITRVRSWCVSCNDWQLFMQEFSFSSKLDLDRLLPEGPEEKVSDYKCQSCGKPPMPVKLKEIPEEKIMEQRERYKRYKRNELFGATLLMMGGGYGGDRIVETDAGQKAIDEARVAKQKAERGRQLAEVDKYRGAERNGPCPCGSGKKYKKCCMHRIDSYKY